MKDHFSLVSHFKLFQHLSKLCRLSVCLAFLCVFVVGRGGGCCLTTCMLFNFKYKMYVYSSLFSIFKFVLNMLGDGLLTGFFFY